MHARMVKRSSYQGAAKGNVHCSLCGILMGTQDQSRTLDHNGKPCHNYCLDDLEKIMEEKAAEENMIAAQAKNV